MYYRRLFGAKWKNYRVTCGLDVTQKEKTQTNDGLVLQMVAKTGFVPPVNLRSESASIIFRCESLFVNTFIRILFWIC
jgi:hypothetical protein